MPLTEADLERVALQWFANLGYEVVNGPDIAPEMPAAERQSYGDVVLVDRLRTALVRCNPGLSGQDVEEVVRRVLRNDAPGLVEANRRFHAMLRGGGVIEPSRWNYVSLFDS